MCIHATMQAGLRQASLATTPFRHNSRMRNQRKEANARGNIARAVARTREIGHHPAGDSLLSAPALLVPAGPVHRLSVPHDRSAAVIEPVLPTNDRPSFPASALTRGNGRRAVVPAAQVACQAPWPDTPNVSAGRSLFNDHFQVNADLYSCQWFI